VLSDAEGSNDFGAAETISIRPATFSPSPSAADTKLRDGWTVKYRSIFGIGVAADVSLCLCRPVIVVLVLDFPIDNLHHLPAENRDLTSGIPTPQECLSA
jgi:hypothetical protein